MAATTVSVRRRSPVYRVTRVLTWLVYAFAVTAIAFLSTAFFLRLFNANESAPFVRWVERATRILMQPFRGIFPAVEGESGSVFDASLLFAIFIYGMLAMGMHALLDWIDRKMAIARYAEAEAARAEYERMVRREVAAEAAVPPGNATRRQVVIPEASDPGDPRARSDP